MKIPFAQQTQPRLDPFIELTNYYPFSKAWTNAHLIMKATITIELDVDQASYLHAMINPNFFL